MNKGIMNKVLYRIPTLALVLILASCQIPESSNNEPLCNSLIGTWMHINPDTQLPNYSIIFSDNEFTYIRKNFTLTVINEQYPSPGVSIPYPGVTVHCDYSFTYNSYELSNCIPSEGSELSLLDLHPSIAASPGNHLYHTWNGMALVVGETIFFIKPMSGVSMSSCNHNPLVGTWLGTSRGKTEIHTFTKDYKYTVLEDSTEKLACDYEITGPGTYIITNCKIGINGLSFGFILEQNALAFVRLDGSLNRFRKQ